MLYIHIGLPKTGTTFLQKNVFPYWNNIKVLGDDKKDVELKQLLQMDKNKINLISKEYIANNYIKSLSEIYPNAKIMISFRKHHEYIKSHYKQCIHNNTCTKSSLDNYINTFINDDTKSNYIYMNTIKEIEENFNQKPFVFLQEEFQDNLDILLNDMENFMGGQRPALTEIPDNKPNKGIGYYQSIILMNINKLFKSQRNPDGIIPKNKYTWLFRESIKYLLQSGPLSIFPKKPIEMDDKQKQLITNHYKNDWDSLLNYIKNESPCRNNFDEKNYIL